jgi:tetrahydromethanopterin S-methyltransferase subunit F
MKSVKQKKLWTIQWHIVADGTVIKQRSRGSAEHEQLFQRYATTRTPKIEEIDAMVEDLERSSAFGERVSNLLTYVGYVALAGLVLGVVSTWVGVDTGFLTLGSLAVVVFLIVSGGFMMSRSISRHQRAYREAGFESSNGVTIAAREARVMIDETGTVSGREFAAVRA